jgi:hypothetical protein
MSPPDRTWTGKPTVGADNDGHEYVDLVGHGNGGEADNPERRDLSRRAFWPMSSTSCRKSSSSSTAFSTRRLGRSASSSEIVSLPHGLDADDPASVTARLALEYVPTLAEALLRDPNEGGIPDQRALDWLTGQGVSIGAIASPIAIRAVRVQFDDRGRYAPSLLGDLAFVLPATDAGGLVDLAAWAPRTALVGTRLGVGAFLGGECIHRHSGDGVTVAPLNVYRSPLDWLRDRRRGVVILDPMQAAIVLSGVVIVPEDRRHANDLRKALRLPSPVVRFPERIAA